MFETLPSGHTPSTWGFIGSTGAPPKGHTAFSWGSDDVCRNMNKLNQLVAFLRSVVWFLNNIYVFKYLERKLEASKTFQAALLRDQIRLCGEENYSKSNFAYGSTPYSTWKTIFERSTALKQSRRVLQINQAKKYTVFGSSVGWMVFYGALTFGFSSEGYELLPFLTQIAQHAQESYDISNVEFKCIDMLQAPLQNTSILLLASQCWDPALLDLVYQKLQAELPDQSLVIDYRPDLAKRDSFIILEHHFGEVSWTDKQSFYVLKKQCWNRRTNSRHNWKWN